MIWNDADPPMLVPVKHDTTPVVYECSKCRRPFVVDTYVQHSVARLECPLRLARRDGGGQHHTCEGDAHPMADAPKAAVYEAAWRLGGLPAVAQIWEYGGPAQAE